MIEPDLLGAQALISFLSTFAGVGVLLYLWCPNRRCCQTSRIRDVCEGELKIYAPKVIIKKPEEPDG